MWCPCKGKYSFGIKGYYECWFHGGDMLWLQFLWEMISAPIRYFYISLRYGVNAYGGIINWYRIAWADLKEELCR